MTSNHFPHLSCVWSAPYNWDTLNVTVDIPNEPGYYAFTDHSEILQPSTSEKNVLYVGIATSSIRERIRKYKTGDTSGIMNLHRGGFFLMLSRGVAHAELGRVSHSVQKKPVEVFNRPTPSNSPAQRIISPQSIYLRWAVDYRAAIEAKLIEQLRQKYNTVHAKD
ncbi:MAG: hypothetical protein PHH11_04845 [Methylomonas sp.]|nr:hypothetical protein [Methylomonas sp.]